MKQSDSGITTIRQKVFLLKPSWRTCLEIFQQSLNIIFLDFDSIKILHILNYLNQLRDLDFNDTFIS
ncbi:hypothetical protein B9G53_20320 [Pseudanabaena sp. SR411]|nr:hypothetical protein B9G53_20320 [Pseudanabaena sp. SR411]